MNSPNDKERGSASPEERGQTNPDDVMPVPQKPEWLKVLIVIFIGIPLGVVALGVLILGVCFVGGR